MCSPKFNSLLYLLLLFIASVSCQSNHQPDAQQIVDEAIAAHGGARYDHGVISFKLRDRQYRALRDGGAFVYSRTFTDSTGQRVHDVLRNSGFTRTVNGVEVALPEGKRKPMPLLLTLSSTLHCFHTSSMIRLFRNLIWVKRPSRESLTTK